MENDLFNPQETSGVAGRQTSMMESRAQDVVEVVIPLQRANQFSFLLFLLGNIVFGGIFIWVTDLNSFLIAWKRFLTDYLTLAIAIIGGMCLHEFTHAFTWSCFCQRRFKAIRFGFSWKHLAPYVHCQEYLNMMPYVSGLLLPGVLLGVIPVTISLLSKCGWCLCFGILFTAGAAGDFLSAFRLRKFSLTDRVKDHPDHLGFFIKRQ